MKRLFSIILISSISVPIASVVAQEKRHGEDIVTHTFTYQDQTLKMGGERSAVIRHLNGVSTNEKGSGMFHNMLVQCVGLIDVVDGKPAANGRCTETDQEGDQLYSTYENKGGAGIHILVGGTGKYKGIAGQQMIRSFTNIKGSDGTSGLVIPLQTTWTLP